MGFWSRTYSSVCSKTGAAVVPMRCIADALVFNDALDTCEFTPRRRFQ